MLRTAWKSLLGRKLRLLMSGLSIVLGVAFLAGSLMFTNLLNSAFQQILKATIADVNVIASATLNMNSGFNPEVLLAPADVAAAQTVSGVAEISPVVSSAEVLPLNADGRVVAQGAVGVAMNYFETPAMDGVTGIHVLEGRVPETDDEVAVDPATLERTGYAIGDQISIATPRSGIKEYVLVGTATFGEGATAGASYQFFTLSEMQNLVTKGQNYYTGMWVRTAPGADRFAVAEQLNSLLPGGFVAQTGEDTADKLQETMAVGLGFVNTVLLIFAGIALLVATLLILNTFSILVTQRSRELALLRAIGAKSSQISTMVLSEAVVVAIIGAGLGLAAGYGLAWLITVVMSNMGIGLGSAAPQLSLPIVGISLLVALLVTVTAAVYPARRASKTRPVEAMTQATADESPGRMAWFGLCVLPAGIAAICCGVFMGVPGRAWWVGLGAVVVLVGALLATALLGKPILGFSSWLYARVFGQVGLMASRNASRQPRRTAATAATLMIGLTLVSSVAILAESTTASVRATLTADERGDFVLSPINYRPFRADLDHIGSIDGVQAVWAFVNTSVTIEDRTVLVTAAELPAFTEGSTLEVQSGQLQPTGGSIMLDSELAAELSLPIGSRFEVTGIDGSAVEVEVTGIINGQEAPRPIGLAVTNLETMAKIGNLEQFTMIRVQARDGVDHDALRAALLEATSEQPTVAVTDNAEYTQQRIAQFNVLFGVIYALLVLALVISVLGIVNTLGLSVLERTREIGLLRAVGLTRPQLRAMVRLEAVVIAVLGSVLGIVAGLGLGTSLVSVLPELGELRVPWLQLLVFMVVAVLVGVVSAITPARRAARMNVLNAIAAE